MDQELKRIVQDALEAEGLWSYMDQNESQFLETDHSFVHLILTDASQQTRTEEVMDKLNVTLSAIETHLEVIVRSRWAVGSVELTGPCYDSGGNLRAATCFKADLHSGSRVHTVEVAFTEAALMD